LVVSLYYDDTSDGVVVVLNTPEAAPLSQYVRLYVAETVANLAERVVHRDFGFGGPLVPETVVLEAVALHAGLRRLNAAHVEQALNERCGAGEARHAIRKGRATLATDEAGNVSITVTRDTYRRQDPADATERTRTFIVTETTRAPSYVTAWDIDDALQSKTPVFCRLEVATRAAGAILEYGE
jgi:hypothetical protein